MKPETSFVVGSARASVFLHRNRNRKSGQEFESYSVHVHRRYEESTGVWKSTSYFRFFELPQVAMALRLATDYVAQREAVQKRADDNETSEVEGAAQEAGAVEAAA